MDTNFQNQGFLVLSNDQVVAPREQGQVLIHGAHKWSAILIAFASHFLCFLVYPGGFSWPETNIFQFSTPKIISVYN